MKFVVATTDNLLVYSLPETKGTGSPSKTKKKGKQKENATAISELKLLRTIDPPAAVSGASGSTFRAARRVFCYILNVAMLIRVQVPPGEA
jgi:hypothetical protein